MMMTHQWDMMVQYLSSEESDLMSRQERADILYQHRRIVDLLQSIEDARGLTDIDLDDIRVKVKHAV